MVATLHLTVRGEVGGRRAEVRLEPDRVRVQVLTVVAQQPAVDLALPLRDLTDIHVASAIQWRFPAVALLFSGMMSDHLRKRSATGTIEWLGGGILLWLFPLGFTVIAFVLRRRTLVVTTQDARAEIDISPLSVRQARRLVAAVRGLRTDLPQRGRPTTG